MRLTVITSLAAALALGGCNTPAPKTVYVTQERELPKQDSRLSSTTVCGDPRAAEGVDLRELARAEDRARGCEAGRVAAWNVFYNKLRSE